MTDFWLRFRPDNMLLKIVLPVTLLAFTQVSARVMQCDGSECKNVYYHDNKCFCCIDCEADHQRKALKTCPKVMKHCGDCLPGYHTNMPHKPEDRHAMCVKDLSTPVLPLPSAESVSGTFEAQGSTERNVAIPVVVVVLVPAIVILMVAGGIFFLWKRQATQQQSSQSTSANLESGDLSAKQMKEGVPLLRKEPVESEATTDLNSSQDSGLHSFQTEQNGSEPLVQTAPRSCVLLREDECLQQAVPTDTYANNPFRTFESPDQLPSADEYPSVELSTMRVADSVSSPPPSAPSPVDDPANSSDTVSSDSATSDSGFSNDLSMLNEIDKKPKEKEDFEKFADTNRESKGNPIVIPDIEVNLEISAIAKAQFKIV